MGLLGDVHSRVPKAWVKTLRDLDNKGGLIRSIKYGGLVGTKYSVPEVAFKSVKGKRIKVDSKGEEYYIRNSAPNKETEVLIQELQMFERLKNICSETSLFDQPLSKDDTTPLSKKELRELLQKHTIAINLLTHRVKEGSKKSRYIGAPPELLLACAAISVGAMDTFTECWKLISSGEEERLGSALELITTRISKDDNVQCITDLKTIIGMWSSADEIGSLRQLIEHSGPTNKGMYNHKRFANPPKNHGICLR